MVLGVRLAENLMRADDVQGGVPLGCNLRVASGQAVGDGQSVAGAERTAAGLGGKSCSAQALRF